MRVCVYVCAVGIVCGYLCVTASLCSRLSMMHLCMCELSLKYFVMTLQAASSSSACNVLSQKVPRLCDCTYMWHRIHAFVHDRVTESDE